MKFKLATGEMPDIKTLQIGTVYFDIQPALNKDDAYQFFDYMYGLFQKIVPSISITTNISAWLSDHKHPFSVKFKWNSGNTIMYNLKTFLYIHDPFRGFKKLTKIMQESDCEWLPECDEFLLETYGIDQNVTT